MSVVKVRIVRRRERPPTVFRRGVVAMVNVTYQSDELAPEILSFVKEIYTPEKELEEITRRVKERLGLEEEVTVKLEELT